MFVGLQTIYMFSTLFVHLIRVGLVIGNQLKPGGIRRNGYDTRSIEQVSDGGTRKRGCDIVTRSIPWLVLCTKLHCFTVFANTMPDVHCAQVPFVQHRGLVVTRSWVHFLQRQLGK